MLDGLALPSSASRGSQNQMHQIPHHCKRGRQAGISCMVKLLNTRGYQDIHQSNNKYEIAGNLKHHVYLKGLLRQNRRRGVRVATMAATM